MILAAGLGTRLKPFTLHTPKPLMPLLGVPCIEFSLLQLKAIGLKNVVVNIHAHASQMEKYLGDRAQSLNLNIQISDESAQLLGSAGGFKKALSKLESVAGVSEAFYSMNSDVVSLVDLKKLALRHQELRAQHGTLITLCLARGKTLENLEGSYTEILVDETSGLITGIGKKKNKAHFYTGTAVFETAAFHHLPLDVPSEFTPEVLLPLIEKKKVGFFWMEDLWIDVGSPELWLKSHFEMLSWMKSSSSSQIWMNEVSEGMKKGYFSEENRVVDYDLHPSAPKPLNQNYIQWKGERADV